MNVSRKRATKWHLFFLYANFFLTFLKGVAIVPLYLKFMDPRLYGAWLACGGIIGYFGLLEFGMNRVLIQKVAAGAGSSGHHDLPKIFSTAFHLNIVFALLPVTIGFLMARFIPGIVQISGQESLELRNAFIVGALAASLMIFAFTPSGILQGLQRQLLVNIFYTGGLALGVITVVVLLFKGYGLLSIPLGSLVHASVTAVGGFFYMLAVLRRDFSFRWQGFDYNVFKDIVAASSFQFGGNVAGTVNSQSDNIVIATMLTPELCNVFTFTGTAYKMCATLVGYLFHAAMPSLAHLAGEGNTTRLRSITGQLIKITILGGSVLFAGAFFLNDTFVNLWVGSQFYGGNALNLLFLFGASISLVFLAFNNVLVSLGEFRASAAATIGQALLQLPLMIVFGYFWGLRGLALAAVLGLAIAGVPIQLSRIIKKFNLQTGEVVSCLGSISAIAIVPFIVGALMNYFWHPANFSQFCIFGVIYLVLTLLVYNFSQRDLRDLLLTEFWMKPVRKPTN